MKKSILTGASVLALSLAGPALAQDNDSDVEQDGSLSDVTVEQSGSNNESDVTQTAGSTWNNAEVTQSGTNGKSTVTQEAIGDPNRDKNQVVDRKSVV